MACPCPLLANTSSVYSLRTTKRELSLMNEQIIPSSRVSLRHLWDSLLSCKPIDNSKKQPLVDDRSWRATQKRFWESTLHNHHHHQQWLCELSVGLQESLRSEIDSRDCRYSADEGRRHWLNKWRSCPLEWEKSERFARKKKGKEPDEFTLKECWASPSRSIIIASSWRNERILPGSKVTR